MAMQECIAFQLLCVCVVLLLFLLLISSFVALWYNKNAANDFYFFYILWDLLFCQDMLSLTEMKLKQSLSLVPMAFCILAQV